jgi:hypothetical protein
MNHLPIMNNALETRQNKQNSQSSAFRCFISPGLVKFLLLFPVLITAIYARSYTGEYQLLINNHVAGVFYVLFGSLFISNIIPSMKFWRAVLFSFAFVSSLEVIHLLRLPLMVDSYHRSLFSFFFGNAFDPADFMFYGIGAVLGLLFLWLLDAANWEKYTEVY